MNESPDKSPIANRAAFSSIAPDKPLSTAPTPPTAPADIEKEIRNARIGFLCGLVGVGFYVWLCSLDRPLTEWLRSSGWLLFLCGYLFVAEWIDYRFLLNRRAQEMTERELRDGELRNNRTKLKVAWVSWFLCCVFFALTSTIQHPSAGQWLGIIFIFSLLWFLFVHSARQQLKESQKRSAEMDAKTKFLCLQEPENR